MPAGSGSGAGGSGGPVAAPPGYRSRGRGGGARRAGAAPAGGGAGRRPDALSRGAPPVAGRLAAELIARGSAALTIPACAACGRTGLPLFRGDGGGGVCKRCRAWQLAAACASCGKVKPPAGRDSTGQRLCEVCHRRDDPGRRGGRGRLAQSRCAPGGGRTSRQLLPAARSHLQQVPAPARHLRHDQPAGLPLVHAQGHRRRARCGQDRPRKPAGQGGLDVLHGGGDRGGGGDPPGPAADTCADCARIPVTCACGDCGIEDKLYEKGRCARCSLRRRAAQLLSAGTGIVAPELTGVLSAVTAARQPRSALNWLRKGAGASLLADVAAGRLAVSHQALDTHPRRRAADYLRHMLTAGGALPPRNEELARAERWLASLLEAIEPAADRQLVQAYATWQVIRRLRASAQQRPRPRTPTAHARNNIHAAAGLLAWLRSGGITLASCGQADIDEWLHTRPSAPLARDFLAWAASRGHCQRLAIPAPPRATGAAISQDQRWALATRLCTTTRFTPPTGSPDACCSFTGSRSPASPS